MQNTVKVSLLQCEELCETLKSSSLHVREIDSRGNTVKEKIVTLLHFSGWPDCDVPSTAAEHAGFNKMMETLVRFYASGNYAGQKAVVHCR